MYRPYSAPVAHPADDAAVTRPDPFMAAAARITSPRVLPPAPVVQVPWWMRALSAIGTALLLVAIVFGFALGAVLVAGVFEGPVVVLALLGYAIGFGWMCRKLRL